ncbi:MAG: hypothetical protein LBS58_02040 [Coriobacteriales bacterium]|jgi:hypothetical protein|nr:hypothetical protein [Coriobacteriales bacterium]
MTGFGLWDWNKNGKLDWDDIKTGIAVDIALEEDAKREAAEPSKQTTGTPSTSSNKSDGCFISILITISIVVALCGLTTLMAVIFH